jgi:crotonobetainyl-CoA:carnitine CoA-transferase CaiB-like acyl-CoA transferase
VWKYRLGIDYERMRAINPRLVYASISGFGQDGPYRARPGLDQIAQGMGGLMSITGLPGQGPVRAGIAVADVTAGVFCAMGILVALLEREESGEGQWVQSSLLAAQIALLDFQAARWLLNQEIPEQAGNNHPTAVPTGVFATANGHINIAASGNDLFARLCKALNADHLMKNPDYSGGRARLRNRDRLNAEIEAITRTRTSAEWIDCLNAAGVPCGPIYRINEVFSDPQVQHLGIARAIDHPQRGRQQLVGQAVELSRTPWTLRMPTPEKGESTDAVLASLGYTSAAIAKLRADGVI